MQWYWYIVAFPVLVGILGSLRVLYILCHLPEARHIDCFVQLPLVFFACLHNWTAVLVPAFGTENCSNRDSGPALIWSFVAAFSSSGILPGLLILIYVPFLALKRSLSLNTIDFEDISWLFTFSLIYSCVWGFAAVHSIHSNGWEQIDDSCYLGESFRLLAAILPFVLGIIICLITWLKGIKTFLQMDSGEEFIHLSTVVSVTKLASSRQSDFHNCSPTAYNDPDMELEFKSIDSPEIMQTPNANTEKAAGDADYDLDLQRLPSRFESSFYDRRPSQRNVLDMETVSNALKRFSTVEHHMTDKHLQAQIESMDLHHFITPALIRVVNSLNDVLLRCWMIVAILYSLNVAFVLLLSADIHVPELAIIGVFLFEFCGIISCINFIFAPSIRGKISIIPYWHSPEIQDLHE